MDPLQNIGLVMEEKHKIVSKHKKFIIQILVCKGFSLTMAGRD